LPAGWRGNVIASDEFVPPGINPEVTLNAFRGSRASHAPGDACEV